MKARPGNGRRSRDPALDQPILLSEPLIAPALPSQPSSCRQRVADTGRPNTGREQATQNRLICVRLPAPLTIYCDISLKIYGEVIPAGGLRLDQAREAQRDRPFHDGKHVIAAVARRNR